MTTILMKRGVAAGLLLAAFTVFSSCDKMLPGDTGTMGIITEIMGVKLTIKGVAPGRAYSVTAYAYPGGEIADTGGWDAATDAANKAGSGMANSSGSSASVRLKGVGGIGAFKQGGSFLAVVTEIGANRGGKPVTRYKSGIGFGSGGATLDWDDMLPPPAPAYTVSFDSLGGSIVQPQTVREGNRAVPPANPTRNNHAFIGWFADESLNVAYDFDVPVTSGLTLYAAWHAAYTYPVSFESMGGSRVDSRDVPEGGKLSPPPQPSRSGHTFAGWFSDEGTTRAYDFNTPVTGGFTLFAKWNINNYTVSFDSGGGSSVPSQSVTYGRKAIRPLADPVKEESVFGGWYLASGGALTQAYDFDTPVTGRVTLHAKWTINNYTVSFDTRGGAAIPPQTVPYGGTATLPEIPLPQNGYAFEGWFADEALSAAYDFASPVKGDRTLYAAWKTLTYKVSFETGSNSKVSAQDIPYGGKVKYPDVQPSRLGHIFGGWYTGDGTLYDFANAEVSSDITLHAKWNGYTIAQALADVALSKGAVNKVYSLAESEKFLEGSRKLEVPRAAPVTIDGNGRRVTGDGRNRLTVRSGVTLILKNITLAAFPITVENGGTLVLDKGAVVTGNHGTGVTVGERGTLEMREGSVVSENRRSGVRVQSNGAFTMSGGAISHNSLTVTPGGDEYGGGVTVLGAGAVFTMTGGEITYNRVTTEAPASLAPVAPAVADGGPSLTPAPSPALPPAPPESGTDGEAQDAADAADAVLEGLAELAEGAGEGEAVFEVSGGEIADNSVSAGADIKGAGGTGGGVSVVGSGAVFTMTGGRIANNVAEFGGGVSVEGGGAAFTMTGGEISDNGAGSGGGGVFISYSASFNMRGGTIKKNSAEYSGGGVYAWDSASFDMTGGVIGGDAETDANKADNGGGVCVSLATMTGGPQIGPEPGGSGKGIIKNNSPHNVRVYSDAGYDTY